jgi:hypothetical protein
LEKSDEYSVEMVWMAVPVKKVMQALLDPSLIKNLRMGFTKY